MKDDALHRRLSRLLAKTESAEALNPAAWWDGDKAGERRVLDDAAAGRLHWASAHSAAKRGLEALASGDSETAEVCVWAATDHYIAALETRIRPSDMKALDRPSQLRGRRKK